MMENRSPFKLFEDEYCNKCEDYNGCIGFILSTSAVGTGDTGEKDKKRYSDIENAYFEMVKNIGISMFIQKYSMILNCMKARKLMKEIQT